ncbi:hypothetical protein KUG47_13085 [Falsochrobactrum sp. TDYN1]|uniref:Uncharacterized protein n=1 Tax=Falsochrobactrum tianjinense TaxID=2706015 RepID=A0A949PQK5_9HYPH|nr:hypothetical protein [Falsochrobactrum sp. TDYN1]MBV2144429.1 hypothetical protein [Falsochrobactrum sp. TDYN1]
MPDRPKQDEQKTERFNMFMSPSEMAAIDDWAWKNKIRSKSEAVRRLCRIALTYEDLKPAINNSMKQLIDAVLILGNETLSERPKTPDEMEELRSLAQEVFAHTYGLYDKLLEQTVRLGGLVDGESEFQEALDWEAKAADFLRGTSFFDALKKSPEAMQKLDEAIASKRNDSKGTKK